MKDLLSNQVSLIQLNYLMLLLGLGLSIILSGILYKLANKFKKELDLTQGIEKALFFLPPIVMSIIFFVGSSLSLSIGLLGSLSIIRFRTSIKSPIELVLILTAIMIGIGLGSQNFLLTTISTLTIFLVLFIFANFINNKNNNECPYYLSIKIEDSSSIEIARIFESYNIKYKLHSIQKQSESTTDFLFELVYINNKNIEKLTKNLSGKKVLFQLNKT